MPPLEQADLRQKAVLWPFISKDKYGNKTVGTAQEIDVRWEDTARQVEISAGQFIAISAQVFVKELPAIGSLMWYGKLADLPVHPTNLVEVVFQNSTPDLKNRFNQKKVSVTRYGNTLPTVGT